jgi:DNA-binding NtrC family response regulator
MATATHIIGKSRHSNVLRKAFSRLAGHRRPCVIVGESGTGKSLFATELGQLDSAFLAIPFGRITEEELEAQLQGCSTGTVLFDDIETSSFRQQKRLADFIAHRAADVRIIMTFVARAAELQSRNKLIDELYGKVLECESVEILPLRERPEDIPAFVRHFAPNLIIDVNGLEALIRRLWHDNVRELRTIIERCLNNAHDGVFRLPAELVEEQPEIVRVVTGMLNQREQQLDSSLDGMERGILERALSRFGFDLSKSATFLGMKREDFEQKVKRLGLSTAKHR